MPIQLEVGSREPGAVGPDSAHGLRTNYWSAGVGVGESAGVGVVERTCILGAIQYMYCNFGSPPCASLSTPEIKRLHSPPGDRRDPS
jgi:hypothetical protein